MVKIMATKKKSTGARGWFSEKERHSEAAKKGWKNRRSPVPKRKLTAIHRSRSPRAQAIDNKRHNKDTIPIKSGRTHAWAHSPNKYDVEGIDTPKGKARAKAADAVRARKKATAAKAKAQAKKKADDKPKWVPARDLMNIHSKLADKLGMTHRGVIDESTKVQKAYLAGLRSELKKAGATKSSITDKTWAKLEDENYHTLIMGMTILGYKSKWSPDIHNRKSKRGKYVKTKGGWYIYESKPLFDDSTKDKPKDKPEAKQAATVSGEPRVTKLPVETLRGYRRHKLLTKEIIDRLPPLYSQENVKDPMVQVKFFSPYSGYTLYVTEASPKGDDILFFGWVEGTAFPELGYSSFKELETASRMGGKLPLIERDMGWRPRRLSKAKK